MEAVYSFEEPDQPDIVALIERLDEFQSSLYPAESNHFLDISALQDSSVHFLVVRQNGVAIGCGAVKIDPRGWGEIKRMYIAPEMRGKGLSKQILLRLERAVAEAGLSKVYLETGIGSTEALRAYERAGYVRRDFFGDYRPDPLSVFMEKILAA